MYCFSGLQDLKHTGGIHRHFLPACVPVVSAIQEPTPGLSSMLSVCCINLVTWVHSQNGLWRRDPTPESWSLLTSTRVLWIADRDHCWCWSGMYRALGSTPSTTNKQYQFPWETWWVVAWNSYVGQTDLRLTHPLLCALVLFQKTDPSLMKLNSSQ